MAVAGLAPQAASAADLGNYEERETIVERPAPPPVVERDRIIERRYYDADDYDYDEGPVVAYYGHRYYRPYPYYANYRPYGFGPGFYHHRHWWRHGRW
jgi:hypothetical protein